MRRQLLDPVGGLPPVEVVRRLCGVQAQVASSAELAVRVRQQEWAPGDVAAALADGRLIKTWAMRGTLHLLTPEDAGAFLSLLAAGRLWERPSWIRYFGVAADDWPELRAATRDALDGRALSREELVSAIVAVPRFRHLDAALRSGWGSLLKPLAWQGDLCFGPSRGNRVTFITPASASSRWAEVPNADEAAPQAIAGYLRAYGPATAEGFSRWLARGWAPKRQLRRWFDAMADQLIALDVDGEQAFVMSEDADELLATPPTDAVRLVPAFDQWVLGPGTDDSHVIPARRRNAVSRQAGWIAPTVLVGGVVGGTWELDGNRVRIAWFREVERPRRGALEDEVARLSAILGRRMDVAIESV